MGRAVVLMAGIADDEADVVLVCELQSLGHMDGLRYINCISDKVSKSAGLGDRVIWVACSIGEERGHERRGGLVAARNNQLGSHPYGQHRQFQELTYCSSGRSQPSFKAAHSFSLYAGV